MFRSKAPAHFPSQEKGERELPHLTEEGDSSSSVEQCSQALKHRNAHTHIYTHTLTHTVSLSHLQLSCCFKEEGFSLCYFPPLFHFASNSAISSFTASGSSRALHSLLCTLFSSALSSSILLASLLSWPLLSLAFLSLLPSAPDRWCFTLPLRCGAVCEWHWRSGALCRSAEQVRALGC